MAQCLIGLGSNIGDREGTLRAAWQAIGQFPQTSAVRLSQFFGTQPVGGPVSQSAFVNAVGLIETSLAPPELLQQLLDLEKSLGRVRVERWGPRAIDLDLLTYANTEIRTPLLTLPHPRMAFRRFVLKPAADVAPDFTYPTNGWTVRQLLSHLDTASDVIAVTAMDEAVLRKSLEQIASRTPVQIVSASSLSEPSTNGWTLADHWPLEVGNDPHISDAIPLLPKLVVVIDSPADKSSSAAGRRARWQRLAHRPNVGPALWLPEPDPSIVADEVVAAMAAMR